LVERMAATGGIGRRDAESAAGAEAARGPPDEEVGDVAAGAVPETPKGVDRVPTRQTETDPQQRKILVRVGDRVGFGGRDRVEPGELHGDGGAVPESFRLEGGDRRRSQQRTLGGDGDVVRG